MKAYEEYYDKYDFTHDEDKLGIDIQKLKEGKNACNHFREIVNNLHKTFYSSVFPMDKETKDYDFNLGSQNDVEMILSVIAINHEIFRRSNSGFADLVETSFHYFLNWATINCLSPSEIFDQKQLALEFCKKKLRFGDAIITFNYDLLLDQALYQSQSWSPIHKAHERYYCGYHEDLIVLQETTLKEYLSNFRSYNKVQFIKPHGSINWFIPPTSEGVLSVPDDDYILAKLYDLTKGACYFDESLRSPKRGDWESYPHFTDLAIVKPTIGKEYSRSPYSTLVQKALKAVRNADEIYLIGYSLPRYDLLSECLILSLKSDCKITIVNRSEDGHLLEKRLHRYDVSTEPIEVYSDGLENWLATGA